MLLNLITRGLNELKNGLKGLNGLIFLLALISYVILPNNTDNGFAKHNTDCTGLIASGFVQAV